MRTHNRRSVRIRGHDYAGGLYVVTVCTFGRQRLFGRVLEGEMVLSAFGEIASEEWLRTGDVRETVVLDTFVVMPDHVHLMFGIVEGPNDLEVVRRGTPPVCPYPSPRRFGGSQPGTVSTIMRQYKSVVTKRIRALDPTVRVWQRGFHDRVVRTDLEADAWRRYIQDNPATWDPGADRDDRHRP